MTYGKKIIKKSFGPRFGPENLRLKCGKLYLQQIWNILPSNDAWNGWQCALVAQRCLCVCASQCVRLTDTLTNGKCIREDSFPPLGDLKTISFSTPKASLYYSLTFSVPVFSYFLEVKKELNVITDTNLNQTLNVLWLWERIQVKEYERASQRNNVFFCYD